MCHACTPLIPHTAGVRVDRAAPCRGRRHRRQRTGLCTRAPHVRCCRNGASPRAEHDGGLGCALCAMSGVCLHGVVVHTAIYLHESTHPSPAHIRRRNVELSHPDQHHERRTRMCVKVNSSSCPGQHFSPRGVRIEFLSGTHAFWLFLVPKWLTNRSRWFGRITVGLCRNPPRVLLACGL